MRRGAVAVWVSRFPISEPTRVMPQRAAWNEMREALRRAGFALVYGRVADWAPPDGDARALSRLLGGEIERYHRILHPQVRRRFAASRALLRHAAGMAVGAAPELFEIARHPNGRPYLRGLDGVEVSISHTGPIVVAGISRLGAIGVDVESTTRRVHCPEMADRLCSVREQEELDALPPEAREAYLIRLWTLKEAYSKALGLGLRLSFRTFGFDLAPDTAAARLVRPDGAPVDDELWSFESHGLEGRYAVGMAVSQGAFGGTRDADASTMLDPDLLATVMSSGGSSGLLPSGDL